MTSLPESTKKYVELGANQHFFVLLEGVLLLEFGEFLLMVIYIFFVLPHFFGPLKLNLHIETVALGLHNFGQLLTLF